MDADENLVGMEQRMQDLDPCLEIGINDVRMIGIKGMGGAGKTTLAWAIIKKISMNFVCKSFVENVREKASKFGLEKLQEQVLKDVLKGNNITVSGVNEGISLMKKKLCGKEVLVVLDDVDHKDQLEALAGDTTWFKPGSRIIITTRDGQVLEEHKVKWIRDVSLLSEEEAIRLFSRHAFGKDIPTQGFEKHSLQVVRYAVGLPLTIKVLGSKLCGKDNSEWTYTLERLKTMPLKETINILELSYENLEVDYKEIFLNVACFLRDWVKDDAIILLEGYGVHARNGLRVLEKKSLLTSKDSYIQMHDHLVEMGKNIVRRGHPYDPSKHSRLWVEEEIIHVLVDNSGSETTRCIDLKLTRDINLKGLVNMKKLRCLVVHGSFADHVKFDEACQYFPNSLQYLNWHGYPHWCLPKTFEANNLVALNMTWNKIEQLWQGGKVMNKLRFLNLSYSRKLRILDLGLTPNLERLNLHGCKDLVKLDVHRGCLKSLVYLNLKSCNRLKSIVFIEQLESLEVLNISGINMREFSEYITEGHSINSLQALSLSCCIEEIPSSIGNLHKLVSLDLSYCHRLKSVPGSICSLKHLTTLNLSYCDIKELPEEIGQMECLEDLALSYTNVKHLPCSICMLKHLKTLDLSWCKLLEKLPEDVGKLECLKTLNLQYCTNLREIPNSICNLKCLEVLNLKACRGLEKLPDEIGNLKCLQLLNVWYTSITHLPPNIYSFKGLKTERRDHKEPFMLDEEEEEVVEGNRRLELCTH